MKSRHKAWRLKVLALSAILGLGLAACGGDGGSSSTSASGTGTSTSTAAPDEPTRGGVVTIDWVADPTNLDPLKYNVFGSFNVYSLVYNTLYRWTEDADLLPELATAAPEVSADGLTYTMTLQEGVNWHDGTPFTSADVKHTIDTARNPENGSTWYASMSFVSEVATPDDYTVVLTLSRPFSLLQGMLAQIPIISASKPYVANETWANTMMGTGPFKFVKWDQGSQVVLERNDDYFVEGLPYLDGVVMRTVSEDAARIANIAGGTADIMPMVPGQQIETLRSRGVNVVTTPKSVLMPTLFPSMKEGRPTSDPEFRRAVAWAIDRGQIIESVYAGAAVTASTLLANGTSYWDAEIGDTYGTSANLDKAKEALAKTDVPADAEIELVVRNEPLAISLGTVLQSNLQALGLQVRLSPEESASYLPKLFSGDFDLMMLDIEAGLSSGFTPFYNYAAVQTGSGSNYIGFSDPIIDELLNTAVADPADPAAAWRAVQERDLEILPYIPTVTARYTEAFSERLKGHVPSSLLSLRDLDQSWIEE